MERRPVPDMAEKVIAECLAQVTGAQMHTPPSYSALKHKGKPLYYYARKGIKVVKEPRLINIKELHCLSQDRDTLALRVVCSKGTYIRTLAADIGEFLGCGAHLSKLKRTRNGFFFHRRYSAGRKTVCRGNCKILAGQSPYIGGLSKGITCWQYRKQLRNNQAGRRSLGNAT
jgi:tRNA pseudouridine(55) synthase